MGRLAVDGDVLMEGVCSTKPGAVVDAIGAECHREGGCDDQ